MPSIYKKQELLEGLFKIYFTNKMNIPLGLSGKIKKPEFKVFFYDLINNKIEENSAHLYLYKHLYKYKNSFEIEMNFRVVLFDKEEHKFELKLPYTSYPDYYIHFYLKGKDPKYNIITFINILANFPKGYTGHSIYKTFHFYIDGEKKDFDVYFKREAYIQNNTKFIYFLINL